MLPAIVVVIDVEGNIFSFEVIPNFFRNVAMKQQHTTYDLVQKVVVMHSMAMSLKYICIPKIS